MHQWTPDEIQRLVVNPFYAITVSPASVIDHAPRMSQDRWIDANCIALELDASSWLRRMLTLLQQDEVHDDQTHPYHAIVIDPTFAVEHEPLIGEEEWIRANLSAMAQSGMRSWLETLLRVLQGGYVASSEGARPQTAGLHPRARRRPHARRR
jgi:hypothetical protein